MGRPREFNPEIVLEKVIHVFWERGFEGTSFSDLERATGLKRASLFAAYGDKQHLFLRALERYQAGRRAALDGFCCKGASPRKAVKAWLECALEPHGRSPSGCFSLNAVIEMAPRDRACARLVEKHRQQMEELLRELVRNGISASEFRRGLDAACAARYLLCAISGLEALSRAPHPLCSSSREAQEMIAMIMSALE